MLGSANDTDGDGLCGAVDNCREVVNQDQADVDADGVGNLCDNCILDPNGPGIPDAGDNSQLDGDDDGFGNLCDGDFNQDLVVGAPDFSLFFPCFGQAAEPPCESTDLNGDRVMGAPDFAIFVEMFARPPGPSAIADPADFDLDSIPNDGDDSGEPGDAPCTGGATLDCDDNCIYVPNTVQADADSDGVGDACDN